MIGAATSTNPSRVSVPSRRSSGACAVGARGEENEQRERKEKSPTEQPPRRRRSTKSAAGTVLPQADEEDEGEDASEEISGEQLDLVRELFRDHKLAKHWEGGTFDDLDQHTFKFWSFCQKPITKFIRDQRPSARIPVYRKSLLKLFWQTVRES